MDRLRAFAAPNDTMRELLLITLAFAACVLVLSILSIGCPVKFLTGISCPGCGLTRAWTSLFGLRLFDAFAYHPLFWSVPFAFALGVLPRKSLVKDIMLTIILIAFIALWIFRFLLNGDVVLPESGYALIDIVNWNPPPWWSFIADRI